MAASEPPLERLASSFGARLRTRLEGPNTVGNSREFWAGFVLAVLALVAYPILTTATGNQFSLFLVLALLGLSLSIVWGYAGVLSFGQVVFFGIGAYAFGVVSINFANPAGITGAVLAGTVLGAVVAALLGYFMFYGGVRDVYVTIITLVSTLVMLTFMAQTAGSEWTIGEAALGGFNGMPDIPLLTLGVEGLFTFQFVFNEHEVFVPLLGTRTFDPFYYLALVVLVLTYLGLRALVNTDFGRVLVAIREDEDRTLLFGYDVKRTKLIAFTLGGALAGLSGVLYAARNVYVDPSVFQLYFATLPVVWVSVGGRKRLVGAVLATVAIEKVRLSLGGELALVAVGTLLLLSILLLPGGVIPWVEDVAVPWIRDGPIAWVRDDAIPWVRDDAIPWLRHESIPWLKNDAIPWLRHESIPWLKNDAIPWLRHESVPWLKRRLGRIIPREVSDS